MKTISKLILLMFMFASGFSFSQFAQSETGLQGYYNMSKNIVQLNKKKKWISFSGKTFYYNSSTRITDYKGNTVSADQLGKDVRVTIKLDVSQKYISRPLLSEIRIETVGPE
ncbi:hypothetical protein MNBD_GAMMA09-1199 [hydrothermal vent metagenome]|uniref:Uncharacterized protein n=1 Tax=hydrothermal vent metagenome TaxID=652676 RepID=A0A3B0XRH4_9ZZZZ